MEPARPQVRFFFVLKNPTALIEILQLIRCFKVTLCQHICFFFHLYYLAGGGSLAIRSCSFHLSPLKKNGRSSPFRLQKYFLNKQTQLLAGTLWSPSMVRTKPETMLQVTAHKSPKWWEDFCWEHRSQLKEMENVLWLEGSVPFN